MVVEEHGCLIIKHLLKIIQSAYVHSTINETNKQTKKPKFKQDHVKNFYLLYLIILHNGIDSKTGHMEKRFILVDNK